MRPRFNRQRKLTRQSTHAIALRPSHVPTGLTLGKGQQLALLARRSDDDWGCERAMPAWFCCLLLS